MSFEFIVTVDDCEADCCLADIQAKVQMVLDAYFVFNTVVVAPAEEY